MPRYTSLIGKRIQVSYRAGDILLSAAGALVADSGQSIYLQEQFVQRGQSKTLRIDETSYPAAPLPARVPACEPIKATSTR